MEELEAMLWTAILKEAQKGNKEMRETINQENKIRQEDGCPTVQEELLQYLQETEHDK